VRFLKLATAATAASLVLAAAGSAMATAAPASASHWRFSYTSRLQIGQFNDIAAVSRHDVWAVGEAIKEGDPSATTAIVEQWRGSSWSVVQLPRPERHGWLTAVAGTSPRNVWVFGYVSRNSKVTTFALRWDGSWAVRGTWTGDEPLIYSAVALNSHDVWAFGPGPALHYDGTGWSKPALSFSLFTASAASPTDVWGFGREDGAPIIARLRNGTWSATPVPVKTSGFVTLTGVLPLSDRDVWVAGQEGNGSAVRPIALQLANGKWSDHNPPKAASDMGGLAPDGSGGLWATFGGPYDGQALLHYTGGRWHTVTLPSVKGKATSALVLARLPGSTTVFAAGLLLWGHLPDTEGAILQYTR
jgi:hypothetical protein